MQVYYIKNKNNKILFCSNNFFKDQETRLLTDEHDVIIVSKDFFVKTYLNATNVNIVRLIAIRDTAVPT